MFHCLKGLAVRLLPFAASKPQDLAQPATKTLKSAPAHPTIENEYIMAKGMAGFEGHAMITPAVMPPRKELMMRQVTLGSDFIGFITSGTGCMSRSSDLRDDD
jgi:hypothetical protein